MCNFATREGNSWIPRHLPPKDYEDMMNWIINEAERSGRYRNDLTFVHLTRILTGAQMDEIFKIMSKDQISWIKDRYIIGSPETCGEIVQVRGYWD